MYINPFLLGILATVFAELLGLIVISILWKGGDEDGEN